LNEKKKKTQVFSDTCVWFAPCA